jgi:hypothetical protein
VSGTLPWNQRRQLPLPSAAAAAFALPSRPCPSSGILPYRTVHRQRLPVRRLGCHRPQQWPDAGPHFSNSCRCRNHQPAPVVLTRRSCVSADRRTIAVDAALHCSPDADCAEPAVASLWRPARVAHDAAPTHHGDGCPPPPVQSFAAGLCTRGAFLLKVEWHEWFRLASLGRHYLRTHILTPKLISVLILRPRLWEQAPLHRYIILV